MLKSRTMWFSVLLAALSVIQPRALKLHQKSNRHLSQPFAEQRDDLAVCATAWWHRRKPNEPAPSRPFPAISARSDRNTL